MNLLEEQWMPVRLHDGMRKWISPIQLADPGIASFDGDRADFNGALAQFAIGLLQTASPVDSRIEWARLLKAPPSSETLQQWFQPHAAAFEFEGEGPRFMQDFDLRAAGGEAVGIGSLLIEAPGENSIKNNSDHFIKRGQIDGMCSHCAALALFTLQTNAPAGGAGNRTGLRGGGPLTTLLIADDGAGTPRSLWQTLWLNVLERHHHLKHMREGKSAAHLTFPWLASIEAIQAPGSETAPVQVHPSHVFWGMPRRIRLDLEGTSAGTCDICGRPSDKLIHRYVARPQGLNYKGAWSHPLSPYYESKEGMLPVHPQPGGLGYRHWLGWVLGMQNDKRKVERAAVVGQFLEQDTERRSGVGLRLWAFGFDMDNMKARCWYEGTLPLYGLADCGAGQLKRLREDVSAWLAGAELAASYLRGAVKDAWFSVDARGDFSHVDASFWSRTEGGFYELLRTAIRAAQAGDEVDSVAVGERWLASLTQVAHSLFDSEFVGASPIERQNPARIAQAHRQLLGNLHGPKLRNVLGLPVAAKAAKKTRSDLSKKA